MRPGDVIRVVEQLGDWWRGTVRGQYKWIVQPSRYFYKDFIIPCRSESEEDKPQVEAPRDSVGHLVEYNQRSYYITEQPGDELSCIICLELPSNPHHTDCCGHTLCSSCAAKAKNTTSSCPQCRESLWRSSSDPRIKRHISGLTAYCTNYEKGCEWKGSISGVKGIGDHLKRQCQFAVVRCERMECTQRLERRLLKDHVINKCLMRPVQCPCCGVCEVLGERQDRYNTLTYSQLTNTHYKECPQWPMRCPNHCSTEVKLTRSTLQDHLNNNCPEKFIFCEFTGCRMMMKRKNMTDHIKICPAYPMTCPNYCSTEEKLTRSTLQDHIEICPAQPMTCPNHCSTKEKLTRSTLQDHLNNNCPEQFISCHMCSVRMKRKDMAQHITDHIYEMKQVSWWLSIIALLLILCFIIFKSYMSGFVICITLLSFIAAFSVAIKKLYDIHMTEQTLFQF